MSRPRHKKMDVSTPNYMRWLKIKSIQKTLSPYIEPEVQTSQKTTPLKYLPVQLLNIQPDVQLRTTIRREGREHQAIWTLQHRKQ